MNSTLRDAQAPSYRECLLPSVARTSSITHITPAKKITFFKRGDPRFSGVRLAVHQRTFKSFSALMEELSQRMPLSFGVRSITAPRGLHCLSTLEQLEDGGCYLCSDKKPPKAPSEPGRQQGTGPSAQPSGDFEGWYEVPGTPSSWKNPKAPRRIMLVKNMDPRFQRTVVLSHRNTRSLRAFLNKASDLLHFPVKQVFTISGKKVDSLQSLLHSHLVLVCAGHESFRPPAMEDSRRNGTETLPKLNLRNKNGSWGLKAKQSVIHSRSKSGGRSRQFSLLSERSGISDPSVSLHRTWMGPALHSDPQDTSACLGPLVADDDFEKKVHMNEDGSLSVEMKVRFHLLSDDMLLSSTGARRASTLTTASGECPVLGEVDPLHCVWEGSSGGFSEPGALGLRPCESGSEEAFNQGQQASPGYEIWTNPLYRTQQEDTGSWSRAGLTQHCHSMASWSQGVASWKRTSKASVSSASNDRPPVGSEPKSLYCPRTLEGSMGSCSGRQSSRATSKRRGEQEVGCTPWAGGGPNLGPDLCPKGAEEGSREQQAEEEGHEEAPSLGCLKHGPCSLEDALPDSSASARFLEKSSERGEPYWGWASRMGTMTSQQEHTQEGSTDRPALSPSSLKNGDLQAKECGQGTGSHKARDGSVTKLPVALDLSSSWDAEGCSSPFFSCTSAQRRRRKQKSQASAMSSPSTSSFGSISQRSHHRQHHHQRDVHCSLDSPTTKQALSPANKGGACSDGPARSFTESSSSVRKQASKDPESPSSGSFHSQCPPGVSSTAITLVTNSEPQKTDFASNFYHPHFTSAETEGDPELRVSSPSPTPSNPSDCFSSHVRIDHLDEKAGGNITKLSTPLVWVVKTPDGVKSGDHRGNYCSQIDTSLVCGTHGGKTQAPQASQPQGGLQPISGACLVCSRYCPTPPRGQSCVKKHSSSSSSNSNNNQGTDWGSSGGKQGVEKLNGLRTPTLGSKSGATGKTVTATKRSSPSPSPSPRGMSQGKIASEGESLEEREEDGNMMPSTLPHISPEAVICEWLNHIPEEPILIKYEMMDESPNVAGDGPEDTQEDPVDKHSLEGLGELAQAREQPLEGETGERPELDRASVTDDASPKSKEAFPQKGASRGVSDTCEEARASDRTTVGHGVSEGILPTRIPASIQIMKELISSKQGQPSSLPEVSGVVGRRLSHSARTLVTCLARLHFFDEDLGSPVSKVRYIDSPQFQELLATFQSLWPQYDLGKEELDLGLQELRSCQALPDFTSHTVTEDFTPTSSSGVDVCSGSRGSGEGSGPCPVDCALTAERMELPLKMVTSIISYQRPDSRTSGNPEDLRNQHLSSSKASSNSQAWTCATSQDEAGENSREQTLDNSLEQLVDNTMQEAGVQVEKTREEIEKEEMQEEHSKEEEFPEEERVNKQESSVDGTQDGEGIQENTRVQKEEAGRDPDSVDLCPPGMSDKPAEPSSSPSESDSHASEHQSGPTFEPGLKKLPRNAEMVGEQTQINSTQETGEKSSSMAHRGLLDLDPIWVFRLLKKIEKAFMTHFASAIATVRARWSLQNDDLLDQMVAEVEQNLGWRLQESIEKELRKIQSRARRKASRPSREALRWEASMQTEQRRRRFQVLHNLSAFKEQTRAHGLFSLTLEDKPSLSGAPGTELGGKAKGEGFCPCEACMRKKVSPTSSRDTMGQCSAPIEKAFDLQEILQKRKGGPINGEALEGAPEKGGMGLLQEASSRTGSVQGADGELGRQRGLITRRERRTQMLRRKTGKQISVLATTGRKKNGRSRMWVSRKKTGMKNLGMRIIWRVKPQKEVTKVQEEKVMVQMLSRPRKLKERDRQSRGEKEGIPPVSQGEGHLSEASENSSPYQEGRPAPPSAPGGDTPHQRSAPETVISSSSMLSLGKCSQVSQKGSEEEHSNGDKSIADEPKVITQERKVTRMYLESSTSEQEGAPSGPSTPDQGADKDPDLEDRKVVKSLTFTKVVDSTDEFGQDDSDFLEIKLRDDHESSSYMLQRLHRKTLLLLPRPDGAQVSCWKGPPEQLDWATLLEDVLLTPSGSNTSHQAAFPCGGLLTTLRFGYPGLGHHGLPSFN
ncbi:retinitis pigmentosa 1-like 1 protein [Dugong dugon]